ncbi:metallophosphoesterase [Halobacteriales archaeon QH_10_70_21]|jgi:metallophosphoesterase superfamily enzyme|nr:MAG: metallophosphoesterase [Halobacteriales archaeon QH_10_70_21]
MEFEPRDRAVYLPAADALVCADLHVGRDATSNVEFRVGEHEDLLERFGALCERYEPTEAVVAGDLLHSFDRLPTGTAETVRALRDAATAVDCRLAVTPGNHDSMLSELWDGPTADEYRLEAGDADVVVTHGHVPPSSDADWYLVGHDHPTLEVEGMSRSCYLYGPETYGSAGVLMLPAFSRLPAGVAVNDMYAADFQSPLVEATDGLRPVVRDEAADRTHEFPPLGEFRRLL